MKHSLAGSTSLALSIASTGQPLRLRLPTASAGKCAALTGHGDDGSASLTVIASRCAAIAVRDHDNIKEVTAAQLRDYDEVNEVTSTDLEV